MSDKPELKPCPFCGEPVEVDGYKEGSCLDIGCCVSMSLQKSDCLTMEERQTWVQDSENKIYKFSDQAEDKALDEIVKRWNRRADLAKPSEWISVDDRLPEELLWVSVATNPRNEVGVGRVDGDDWCDEYHGYLSVTHWQYKPPPPTRETP